MTSIPSLHLTKLALKQKFHPSFEEWNFYCRSIKID